MSRQSRPEVNQPVTERPSILRIITRLNVGGPARQAILLSKAMAQHGFDSELVCGSEDEREGRVGTIGVKYTRIPSLKRSVDPLRDLRSLMTLRRLVRRRSPHIVHTHLAKAGALGRLAASLAHVPAIVHTFHGHVLEGYFAQASNRTFLTVERQLARRSHALIAVSTAVRDELLELGLGRPDQWRVIPVGLNLRPYLEETTSEEDPRELVGLPRDQVLVGLVGRLVPVKDVKTFLEAAATVANRRRDVMFIVAGDGELRPSLEERAMKLLGNRIKFLGWVSNLAALYSALDIVVLTSRHEGTPTALVEAAASARPVVATRVGGVPEIVRDGLTGLLVRPGSPRYIADAVLSLLADPDRGRKMGVAARDWVRDRFTLERLSSDLAGLYSELLARGG